MLMYFSVDRLRSREHVKQLLKVKGRYSQTNLSIHTIISITNRFLGN